MNYRNNPPTQPESLHKILTAPQCADEALKSQQPEQETSPSDTSAAQSFVNLDKAISVLLEVIAGLEKRLNPILTPLDPAPDQNPTPRPVPKKSQVVCILDEQTNRVGLAVCRVEAIKGRVEL